MLEIHVDVRRLLAGGGDEALEQQIERFRIHAGDADAVADRTVSSRAPALAENPPRACEAHDVVNGEEIRFVFELLDQRQLVLDEGANFLRNSGGVSFRGSFPCESGEVLDRRHALRGQLVGILVAQLVEGERTPLGDLDTAMDRLGIISKEPVHLRGRFEVALAVAKQAIPGT